MKQFGIVQRVRGRFAEVLVSRPAACKSCGACQLMDNRPHTVTVRNDAGAKVGDTVALELPGKDLVRAVLLAYGVPLVMFLAGLAMGAPVARSLGLAINPSLAAAIGGILLLAAGYYGIHLYDRSLGPEAFASVAVAVVDADNLECASNAAGVTRAHKMREAE